MRETKIRLGQLLCNMLWSEIQGILKKNYEVMVPLDGKHGDICVVGGFTTSTVKERARNHDPQYVSYGIAWRKQPLQLGSLDFCPRDSKHPGFGAGAVRAVRLARVYVVPRLFSSEAKTL